MHAILKTHFFADYLKLFVIDLYYGSDLDVDVALAQER